MESEKSIELCIIRPDNIGRFVPTEDIQAVVNQINKEKEEAEAAKKKIWVDFKALKLVVKLTLSFSCFAYCLHSL